jgi:Ino eighty subunit 2
VKPSSSNANGDASAGDESKEGEKEMVIAFGVPVAALGEGAVPYVPKPTLDEAAGEEMQLDSAPPPNPSTAAKLDTQFVMKEQLKQHDLLSRVTRNREARCDVPGCQEGRKYRLVRDWERGACGMGHLKVLEGKA